MKIFINLARFIVGVLFIFSGLVKANDPLGLSYKMQEFFELWGLHALNDYTLAFAVLMIGFEIIAGVAILVGWKMNLFSWLLLLLIIFFTFLTGYAVITGKPKECGCFGDCIPLTAMQSFQKDLILLALIVFLFAVRKKIRPLFSTKINILVLFFSAILSFAFMWYTLLHLPVVDCLPYKKGKSIIEQSKIPPGAIPDSTVITFEYEKNGQKVEFTADKFPDDFNDSIYKNPRRFDKLVRKGNAEAKIKDFTLTNSDGIVVTDSFLNAPGNKLVFFLRDGYSFGDWLVVADALIKQARQQGMEPVLVTSVSKEQLAGNLPPAFAALRIYTCDATAIKTAARANPTVYLLNKDIIQGKWSYADLDRAHEEIKSIK
ncbi:MAG: DoxX family protein [Chitinophagaceae bacterium]|nr:DoxX family protein [Chitinophagaceae bacterium]